MCNTSSTNGVDILCKKKDRSASNFNEINLVQFPNWNLYPRQMGICHIWPWVSSKTSTQLISSTPFPQKKQENLTSVSNVNRHFYLKCLEERYSLILPFLTITAKTSHNLHTGSNYPHFLCIPISKFYSSSFVTGTAGTDSREDAFPTNYNMFKSRVSQMSSQTAPATTSSYRAYNNLLLLSDSCALYRVNIILK